jgi:hypothetical protein
LLDEDVADAGKNFHWRIYPKSVTGLLVVG